MPSISALSLSKLKMRREFHRSSHFHSIVVAAGVAVLDPYLCICEIQNDMRNCIRRNLNFRVLLLFFKSTLFRDIHFLFLFCLHKQHRKCSDFHANFHFTSISHHIHQIHIFLDVMSLQTATKLITTLIFRLFDIFLVCR